MIQSPLLPFSPEQKSKEKGLFVEPIVHRVREVSIGVELIEGVTVGMRAGAQHKLGEFFANPYKDALSKLANRPLVVKAPEMTDMPVIDQAPKPIFDLSKDEPSNHHIFEAMAADKDPIQTEAEAVIDGQLAADIQTIKDYANQPTSPQTELDRLRIAATKAALTTGEANAYITKAAE